MLFSNLQRLLQSVRIEVNPVDSAVLYYPHDSLLLWWLFQIKRTKRQSQAPVHLMTARVRVLTDQKIRSTNSDRIQAVQDNLRANFNRFPTDRTFSCLNWWWFRQELESLYNCSTSCFPIRSNVLDRRNDGPSGNDSFHKKVPLEPMLHSTTVSVERKIHEFSSNTHKRPTSKVPESSTQVLKVSSNARRCCVLRIEATSTAAYKLMPKPYRTTLEVLNGTFLTMHTHLSHPNRDSWWIFMQLAIEAMPFTTGTLLAMVSWSWAPMQHNCESEIGATMINKFPLQR